MLDLAHLFGGDLQAGSTGDVALAGSTTLTQQRILRRLLTNPGDYIWHPEYGAGLPRFVGTVAAGSSIEALIRSQILLEPLVAQVPEPSIEVQVDEAGTVYVHMRYADATTGMSQVLSFTLDG